MLWLQNPTTILGVQSFFTGPSSTENNTIGHILALIGTLVPTFWSQSGCLRHRTQMLPRILEKDSLAMKQHAHADTEVYVRLGTDP